MYHSSSLPLPWEHFTGRFFHRYVPTCLLKIVHVTNNQGNFILISILRDVWDSHAMNKKEKQSHSSKYSNICQSTKILFPALALLLYEPPAAADRVIMVCHQPALRRLITTVGPPTDMTFTVVLATKYCFKSQLTVNYSMTERRVRNF